MIELSREEKRGFADCVPREALLLRETVPCVLGRGHFSKDGGFDRPAAAAGGKLRRRCDWLANHTAEVQGAVGFHWSVNL